MSRLQQIEGEINKISNAYLYYSLYSNGFLKSKPVTLGNNTHDITNKMMHLCKSAINKKFKDRPDMIYHTKFSGNYLTAELSNTPLAHSIKRTLLTGYVNTLKAGLNEEVKEKLKISFTGNTLTFVTDFFKGYGYGSNYNTRYTNLKARLDGIVEAVMTVPNITNLIIEFIDNHLGDVLERDKTLYDLYLIRKSNDGQVDTTNIDNIDVNLLKDIVLPEELNNNEYFESIAYTGYWNRVDVRPVLYRELYEHNLIVPQEVELNEQN